MERELNYENVKYGMLVEVLHKSGYHAGCKVHFFNKKGVLIGNYYEFVPYQRLRLRKPFAKDGKSRIYQRFFYKTRFEKLKRFFFMPVLTITSFLIRWTQKFMD